LHYAVGDENLAVARALLKRRADPNARIAQRESGGWTPLHFACKFGNLDLVSLLLDFGADPFAVGFDGETVFDVADGVPHATRAKLADMLNAAASRKSEEEEESSPTIGGASSSTPGPSSSFTLVAAVDPVVSSTPGSAGVSQLASSI